MDNLILKSVPEVVYSVLLGRVYIFCIQANNIFRYRVGPSFESPKFTGLRRAEPFTKMFFNVNKTRLTTASRILGITMFYTVFHCITY